MHFNALRAPTQCFYRSMLSPRSSPFALLRAPFRCPFHVALDFICLIGPLMSHVIELLLWPDAPTTDEWRGCPVELSVPSMSVETAHSSTSTLSSSKCDERGWDSMEHAFYLILCFTEGAVWFRIPLVPTWWTPSDAPWDWILGMWRVIGSRRERTKQQLQMNPFLEETSLNPSLEDI